MISNERSRYASPSEWLSLLRQDDVWLSYKQQLTPPDDKAHMKEANRRIGMGPTFEYWELYRHQVEPVVEEVWGMPNLTLPQLKLQTIGMLTVEWLEQHGAKVTTKPVKPAAESAPPMAQETFADRVKAIMRQAATKNGQRIETTTKGHAGAYLYHINAEAFCRAMDEMVSTYGEQLKELLGGTLHCLQVTKVCFFIGNVIRMHVINDVNLQVVDMLFAFEDYYANKQTVKAKLGDRKITSEQKVVLGYFEGLLRKYTAK